MMQVTELLDVNRIHEKAELGDQIGRVSEERTGKKK